MKPGRKPGDRASFRHTALVPRFRDAFSGLFQAYREEPNLRFHSFAGTCAAVAAYAVGMQAWEVAYLAVTVAAVLTAEMVNTAVERTVDLAADGRRHPLAAEAKEVAAGAVLLVALHAVFAAFYLFIYSRGLLETITAVLDLVRHQPWAAVPPVLAGILGVSGGKVDR